MMRVAALTVIFLGCRFSMSGGVGRKREGGECGQSARVLRWVFLRTFCARRNTFGAHHAPGSPLVIKATITSKHRELNSTGRISLASLGDHSPPLHGTRIDTSKHEALEGNTYKSDHQKRNNEYIRSEELT
jgi:hypothetical protein